MFVYGIIVALATIVLDQISKWWLLYVYHLAERGSVELLPFLNLVMVRNFGVSFGMLRSFGMDNRVVMIALTTGITVSVLVWLYHTNASHRFLARGLGLVIGGACGNIVDRFRFGAVFDFLDFHIKGWHWPAFNIADSAICIGVCLILLDSFLCNQTSKK